LTLPHREALVLGSVQTADKYFIGIMDGAATILFNFFPVRWG